MDAGQSWRNVFRSWPAGFSRSGLLVTVFQESIPFVNFMLSEGVVLLERDRPDALGGRKVMVAFTAIAALKLTDTTEFAKYKAFGFEGAPAGK